MNDSAAKTRVMTPKGFIHKARTAKSALAFIAAYRDYMVTGDLAPITAPILAKVDEGTLMATPGLSEIVQAVFAHTLQVEVQKGEAKVLAGDAPKTQKPYECAVYLANGEVATRTNDKGEEEDITASFELWQRATEWCDRRLFDGAAGWYGEVVATKLIIKGKPMVTHIKRDESIERILKVAKGPVMHKKPQSTSALSFGVKCKQDVAKFSRG